MTQLEAARKGIITPQMDEVAADEGLSPDEVCALVATGALDASGSPQPCRSRQSGTTG